MIIGCDLDGTICDNLPLLIEELNNFTGQVININDIKDYDVTKVYDLTREQFTQLMQQREANIIEKSPEIAGAARYFKQLVNEHQLHIITARNQMHEFCTRRWLEKHQFPYHGLHLLNSHDKVDICKELVVDVMVEDNYHNAVQLAAAGIEVILFNAPHNLHWPWPGKRCGNWDEIYSQLLLTAKLKNHKIYCAKLPE
ncbi:hypothetical protein V6C27_09210 [Peptococcaceae bacterium 1198_IL3148]